MANTGLIDIYILKNIPTYFDRRIFFYESLQEYLDLGYYEKKSDINFNPADGVRTVLVVNTTSDEFSYLLAVDPATNNIISRWFIVEGDRNLKNQYSFSLKRDGIADNFNDVLTAPTFIEKANLRDSGNPLLFNKEGMTFNQIKREETPLKDKTGVAWLVGYILQDSNRYPTSGEITASTKINAPVAIPYGDLSFGDAIRFSDGSQQATRTMLAYSDAQLNNVLRVVYGYRDLNELPNANAPTMWLALDLSSWDSKGQRFNNLKPLGYIGSQYDYSVSGICMYRNLLKARDNYSGDYSLYTSYFRGYFLEKNGLVSAPSGIWDYNGKIIKKDNKYYRLSLSIGNDLTAWTNITGNESDYRIERSLLFLSRGINRNTSVSFERESQGLLTFFSNDNEKISVGGQNLSTLSIVATEIQAGTIKTHISASRNHIEDDCFDMFAIPYNPHSEEEIYFSLGGTDYILKSQESLAIARAIMTEGGAGAGWAKDLQLLPYCPFNEEEIIDSNEKINLVNLTEGVDFERISLSDDSLVVSFMLLCKRANFTKNIELLKQIARPQDITYTKHEASVENALMSFSSLPTPAYTYSLSLDDSGISADFIDTWVAYDTLIERYNSSNDTWEIITTSNQYYSLDKENNRIYVRYPVYLEGQYRVTFKISVNYKQIGDYLNPLYLDLKISNECDLYRLVSPNYNGLFEFSLAKFIDGKMNYINVDCSYKPFIPYIHLNPDFSGLYGQDWNDSTGLICGGDYSLSLVSDAWINYTLNNKNYQAIFDRQIKSLDVNNAINTEKTVFSSSIGALTGGLGGATGGAMAGFKSTGSPYGAAAGAIVGGTAGLTAGVAGGFMDIDWLTRQQREQRLYSVDLYNYTLGNIQAIPQSISKSSPFTYNNKIYPILERFSATETEKDILKEKIKYEGMTIMSISQIVNFLSIDEETYIKGRLIRSGSIQADSHLIEDIYSELAKGVFINL